jgi:hypothetical protein
VFVFCADRLTHFSAFISFSFIFFGAKGAVFGSSRLLGNASLEHHRRGVTAGVEVGGGSVELGDGGNCHCDERGQTNFSNSNRWGLCGATYHSLVEGAFDNAAIGGKKLASALILAVIPVALVALLLVCNTG